MLLIDNDFLPQALALIGMARHSIYISTFKAEFCQKAKGCVLRSFFSRLYEKAQDGVEVKFLINCNSDRRATPLTNIPVIQELKKHKIIIKKLPNNRCCHAKIIIIDKRRAIVGSHNLSVRACHYNFEASYLFSDEASVARLCSVFEHNIENSQDL